MGKKRWEKTVRDNKEKEGIERGNEMDKVYRWFVTSMDGKYVLSMNRDKEKLVWVETEGCEYILFYYEESAKDAVNTIATSDEIYKLTNGEHLREIEVNITKVEM